MDYRFIPSPAVNFVCQNGVCLVFFLYVYVFVCFSINISEDEFQSEVFDDPYLSS